MTVVFMAFASGMLALYMPFKGYRGIDPNDIEPSEKTQDDSFQGLKNTFITLLWILIGKKEYSTTTKLLTYRVVLNLSDPEVVENHAWVNEDVGKSIFLAYHFIACLMFKSMLAGVR